VAHIKEMTKEEAKAFLRKVMGYDSRTIEGVEKEHLLTVFQLIEPTNSSNNQRFWTDVYIHAGKEYHHTIGEGLDELTEILPDDL